MAAANLPVLEEVVISLAVEVISPAPVVVEGISLVEVVHSPVLEVRVILLVVVVSLPEPVVEGI